MAGASLTSISPTEFPRGKTTSAEIVGTDLDTFIGTPTIPLHGDTENDDVAATNVVVVDATHITCDFLPPGAWQKDVAQTSDITATDGIQSPTLANSVQIVANPPVLTSITPDHGPEAGGTAVTVAGSGLNIALDAGAHIGGFGVDDWTPNEDGTEATGTTQSGTPGLKDLTISTEDGDAPLTDAFTYDAAGGKAHKYGIIQT